MAEEVLASGDAARYGERDFALVRDQRVDRPLSGRGVEAVLVDLEPLKASHARLSCAGDLGTRIAQR